MSHEQRFGTSDGQSSTDPLSVAWNEAFDRMYDASGIRETDEILAMTAMTNDPEQVAAFREQNRERITPQSVFFLQVSEAVKRARAKDGQPLH